MISNIKTNRHLRSRCARAFFVAVYLASIATFTVLAGPADKTPPNILVILSDDQGYGDLSLHGNPYLKTPNIDRLATNNIQFEHFFVSPLCAPTRASFLTGRYSLRVGVKGVGRGEETMPSEEITLAEVLRDAGYRTGLFGKWHNGENFPYTPNGQGFEENLGFNLGHWNNYFDTTLQHNGQRVKTHGYITDVLTDAALGFMETNRHRPFFCYIANNVPHTPLQVPDKYFNHYKALGLDDWLAAVYGMCANLDDNVGRLLAKLDELKLRENTIVIFFSDNGPHGARFNAGMRGLKGTLHEGGSRVPCFLSWPARFKSPRKVTQIAAHIDLLPTLLDLCGLDHPKNVALDGRSLVPLLNGATNKWTDRAIFGQFRPPGVKKGRGGALRTQRHRLVNDGKGWELFDMEQDPGETHDISRQEPELKRTLIAQYDAWWKEVLPGASLPVPPIQVGHPEENPVELSVSQSEFDGGIQFSGKFSNNAWLNNWTNPIAKITWNIDVVRAGKYEVVLNYLCPKADAGSQVRIRVGRESVEATTRETAYYQVPSPDRAPRDEVYEMQWSALNAGTLPLEKGKATLELQAVKKTGLQILELKSVSLKRIE